MIKWEYYKIFPFTLTSNEYEKIEKPIKTKTFPVHRKIFQIIPPCVSHVLYL